MEKIIYKITIGIWFVLLLITVVLGMAHYPYIQDVDKTPLGTIIGGMVFFAVSVPLPMAIYGVLKLANIIKCSFGDFYLIQSVLFCILIWITEYAFGAFGPYYSRKDDAANIVFPILCTICIIMYIGICHWERKIEKQSPN